MEDSDYLITVRGKCFPSDLQSAVFLRTHCNHIPEHFCSQINGLRPNCRHGRRMLASLCTWDKLHGIRIPIETVTCIIIISKGLLRSCVCVCVCVCIQLYPTLCNPMYCSPPGSSVREILQARTLEWVAIPFPQGLPDAGIKPASLVPPALAGRFFYQLSHQGSNCGNCGSQI